MIGPQNRTQRLRGCMTTFPLIRPARTRPCAPAAAWLVCGRCWIAATARTAWKEAPMRNGWFKDKDGELVLVRETRDGWVVERRDGRREEIKRRWLR